MGRRISDEQLDQLVSDRAKLTEQIAGLRGEIKALREEKDRTQEVRELEKRIEQLTIARDRMEEDNARSVREVEHRTGLMRKQVEADTKAAIRTAQLEVRESNLAAEQTRFERDMEFQREQMRGEVQRVSDLVGQLMDRLPTIEIGLEGTARSKDRGSKAEDI